MGATKCDNRIAEIFSEVGGNDGELRRIFIQERYIC